MELSVDEFGELIKMSERLNIARIEGFRVVCNSQKGTILDQERHINDLKDQIADIRKRCQC